MLFLLWCASRRPSGHKATDGKASMIAFKRRDQIRTARTVGRLRPAGSPEDSLSVMPGDVHGKKPGFALGVRIGNARTGTAESQDA